MMRQLGVDLGLPIHVYGPETHMTAIVALALGQDVDAELMNFAQVRGRARVEGSGMG